MGEWLEQPEWSQRCLIPHLAPCGEGVGDDLYLLSQRICMRLREKNLQEGRRRVKRNHQGLWKDLFEQKVASWCFERIWVLTNARHTQFGVCLNQERLHMVGYCTWLMWPFHPPPS